MNSKIGTVVPRKHEVLFELILKYSVDANIVYSYFCQLTRDV